MNLIIVCSGVHEFFLGVDWLKIPMKNIAVALIITLFVGLLPSCSNLSSHFTNIKNGMETAIGNGYNSISKIDNKGLPHALHSGINGDLEQVIEAVEAGADVDKKLSILFGPEATPLWYSIRNGQCFIPAYLLSKGADPNFVNDQGISILMFTVGANAETGITYANATDHDVYKILLDDKRTKVNLRGKLGFTALDYACRDGGDLDKVNYLISHGATITATTMKCAINGFSNGHCDPPVLRLVLDSLIKQGIPSGLDPEIEAAILGDSHKLLSLYNTGEIKQQNMQVVQFLTAAFCDADTLRALASSGVNLNASYNYETLLSTASKFGKLETVEYIVNQHVSIDAAQPPYDDTALTKAIRWNRLDIAQFLRKSGAEFQTFEDTTAPNVLEIACENGNMDMIKWILDSGYSLTMKQEVDAMTGAAQNDRIDVLKYLLDDKKFDINAEDGFGYTTLENVSGTASLSTIKFLVDNGANVNGEKGQYTTPLTGAVMGNRADVAKYLIEKGADVNLAGTNDDAKSSRPLTEAIQTGLFDMVKLLVDSGASVGYHEGWDGGYDTPHEMARVEGSKRILEYIKAAEKKK